MNIGTLWRSAYLFGAAGIFTIGRRIKHQASDTTKATHQIPYRHYLGFNDLLNNRPYGAMIVGVELTEYAHSLNYFCHPRQAIYVLGAEDHGIPHNILSQCNFIIKIPTVEQISLNVSVAGSIVMFDRHTHGLRK